ncbi:MAG TPA: flagella basal body P-ring formation protein FlgA, partial [Candidatus Ozemobacteraceae bacterium]|nr:flagella basal body P-ring formation protein FlgA [Candidatus Ozemobacteraceae bacterium]
VLRKGSMLAGDEIGTKVRELCLEALASDSVGDIQIDLSRIPHHVVLPGPLGEWKLTPMSSNKLGMRIFQFEARCGDDTVRQILQADVCKMIRAARLRRLVKRGERVSAADLIEEQVRLRTDQPNPPVPLTAAAGKQLANFKSPGTMLRESDLAEGCIPEHGKDIDSDVLIHAATGAAAEPHFESPALPGETGPEPVSETGALAPSRISPKSAPLAQLHETPVHQVLRADSIPATPDKLSMHAPGRYLIKSGDKVEFTVKSGNLSLVVPAKALQSGRAGEAIKLLNLQNNRQIKGIITTEGKVEHVAN